MNTKQTLTTVFLIFSVCISQAKQPDQNSIKTEQSCKLQTGSESQHPQSEKILFNPLDDNWWNENVGYKAKNGINIYDPEYLLDGRLVFSKAKTVPLPQKDSIINRYIKSSLIGHYKDPVLEVTEVEVLIQNCISESSCRVYTRPDVNVQGNLIIENTTFVRDENAGKAINGTAISGLSGIIRYNIINSNDNGVSFDGGLTNNSIIEYNWIIGPGEVIGTLHQDGIEVYREGNSVIRRNKIEGFPNACIIIGSAVAPRQGANPVENVTITENYFLKRGLKHFYLYVREKDPNVEYMKRPRFITITDNWFEDKSITPISSGENPSKRAMFVRTEEERREGIRRQEEYPEVLGFRENLGNCATAVDARTWIVWNNNRWNDAEKTEIPPDGGKWYDLSKEQAAFASVASVTLNKTNASLTVGEVLQLTASISPSNARNKKVTWSSSDPAIASVDVNGKVMANNKGSATITIETEDGNKTAECQVIVKEIIIPVNSITLNETSALLSIGEILQLIASIDPINTTSKSTTWFSSDPSIASVDVNGKVTANNKGSATITIETEDGNKTAECQVTVKDNSTGINDPNIHSVWIFTDDNTLYIDSPSKETIIIYSVTGEKLLTKAKAEGIATINISGIRNEILIIKSNRGWVKKLRFKIR